VSGTTSYSQRAVSRAAEFAPFIGIEHGIPISSDLDWDDGGRKLLVARFVEPGTEARVYNLPAQCARFGNRLNFDFGIDLYPLNRKLGRWGRTPSSHAFGCDAKAFPN
jgi:hypothetical protein